MIWIAPSEKDTDTAALKKRLWDAAEQFRANSGLIFLRFAEVRRANRVSGSRTGSKMAKEGNKEDNNPIE